VETKALSCFLKKIGGRCGCVYGTKGAVGRKSLGTAGVDHAGASTLLGGCPWLRADWSFSGFKYPNYNTSWRAPKVPHLRRATRVGLGSWNRPHSQHDPRHEQSGRTLVRHWWQWLVNLRTWQSPRYDRQIMKMKTLSFRNVGNYLSNNTALTSKHLQQHRCDVLNSCTQKLSEHFKVIHSVPFLDQYIQFTVPTNRTLLVTHEP
jgi:hypothetical protein